MAMERRRTATVRDLAGWGEVLVCGLLRGGEEGVGEGGWRREEGYLFLPLEVGGRGKVVL